MSADDSSEHPGWLRAYKLLWKRRRLLWRSFRSRHQLKTLSNRTTQIRPGDILAVTTLRNEVARLPWFFEHYRRIGVDHFLMIDNGSDDGSDEWLLEQPDVSLWQTYASYRAARFGLDWMTWLQMRYGHNHWMLMIDADELLIYAHHQSRSLHDLTSWLETSGQHVFGAHLLDLYPKGSLSQPNYMSGADPMKELCWFDASPYRSQRQQPLGNLWVQGGMRERAFFSDNPRRSPTLNKIPLVKWSRRYAYVNSCHSALPRRLNFTYDGPEGKSPSGVLLHTKFLPEIVWKSTVEKLRGQHFHNPDLFDHYYDGIAQDPSLWTHSSTRLRDWQQLEELGLMSSGGW